MGSRLQKPVISRFFQVGDAVPALKWYARLQKDWRSHSPVHDLMRDGLTRSCALLTEWQANDFKLLSIQDFACACASLQEIIHAARSRSIAGRRSCSSAGEVAAKRRSQRCWTEGCRVALQEETF